MEIFTEKEIEKFAEECVKIVKDFEDKLSDGFRYYTIPGTFDDMKKRFAELIKNVVLLAILHK